MIQRCRRILKMAVLAEARSRSSMAEFYKALAAADLPILVPPPTMLMTPLRDMMTAEEAPEETLIYKVPVGFQAIIKMIVCTSSLDGQEKITLRCYSEELGPVPLFGPIYLNEGEWSEWTGSLT